MTGWSGSHFLQSLGWAILNSIWQMALLWIIFLFIQQVFKVSASTRYKLSVSGIFTGFVWFLITFLYYLQSSPVSTLTVFSTSIQENDAILQNILLSASLAYLLLLLVPAYKLFRNWKFVRMIRKQGLNKASLHYRLFVQRMGSQLGITRKVMVYASELVRSPLTIGYLKPIILVPVAALNNLSTQQVEAILLHELSHIKRFDYLVNFLVSIIHTVLYFNPFVKLFIRKMEEERENCCDELVLQFGYDKLGYASALLTLEKLSAQHQALALAATGKKYLLSRIEKIAGIEKKKSFRLNHIAGLLAALFCIIALNSVLIIRETPSIDMPFGKGGFSYAFNNFNIFDHHNYRKSSLLPMEQESVAQLPIAPAITTVEQPDKEAEIRPDEPGHIPAPSFPVTEQEDMFIQVAQNEMEAKLTSEEKEKVKMTAEATRHIISTLQWKEVDKVIGEVLNDEEKALARMEYLKAFEQMEQMKQLEQKLKAQYEKLDWSKIDQNVTRALLDIKLDSLELSYQIVLTELEKAQADLRKGTLLHAPIPDQSLEQLERSTTEMRTRVEKIEKIRKPKVVVKL